ncbi:MAG: ArsR family transcriptional regulator [Cytophagales bacterium]|nr:ArsR family transcriptional regulator [Cytophagales bacterium]
MLDTLISSKTRVKLLLKFFLNPESRAYLRSLAEEFDESTNAIRVELNKFEESGLLESSTEGNRKVFRANTAHPLYKDVRGIILKHVGIDKVVDQVAARLGNLERVYLCGDMARGVNSDVIDIILIGVIDRAFLLNLIEKAEQTIHKKIRYLIYVPGEFDESRLDKSQNLLIYHA